MPSSHLILCVPFSCPQSFPASGSFPVGQLFASGGHRTGVSASASASNEYSGLISLRMDLLGLCIPRDSQESSPTPQFKSLNSLTFSFPYSQTFKSVNDYWKNHSKHQRESAIVKPGFKGLTSVKANLLVTGLRFNIQKKQIQCQEGNKSNLSIISCKK